MRPRVVLVVKGRHLRRALLVGRRRATPRAVALRRAAPHRPHRRLAGRRAAPWRRRLPRRRAHPRRPGCVRAVATSPARATTPRTPTPPHSDEVVFVGARYPAREALLHRPRGIRRAGARLRARLVGPPRRPAAHLAAAPAPGPARPRPAPRRGVRRDGRRPGHPQRARRPGRLHDAHLRGLRGRSLQLVDRADVSRTTSRASRSSRSLGPPGRDRPDPGHDRVRAAGRARTLAEHTFVHRARDLEALWTA